MRGFTHPTAPTTPRKMMIDFDAARAIPISSIAGSLGFNLGQGGRSAGPCPCCKASQRSSKDKRLPVGIRPDDTGWRCQHCHQTGDGLDLVSWELGGSRYKELHNKHDVNQWFQSFGAGKLQRPGRRIQQPRPEPSKPKQELKRPPRDEVEHIWRASISVADDEEAVALFKERKISDDLWVDLVARVLPHGGPRYPWMRCKQYHWHDGWRLIIPCYNSRGVMESIKARWIRASKPPGPKGLTPKGYDISGLVFAEGMALKILEQGKVPWAGEKTLYIRIAEGEMDYIALVMSNDEENYYAPAVVGIWSGAWNDEIAARIPNDDRVAVVICSDPDIPGDKYSDKITKTLLLRGITQTGVPPCSRFWKYHCVCLFE